MSNWVATEIVVTPNIKKRAAVIKHFILIANACLQLRNYNTLLEITAGLNLSVISRLRKTWRIVPSKIVAILKELEDLMDCKSNYFRYRAALKESNAATLPYFGVFLRDFTLADVGNDDYEHSDFVNFDKMFIFRNLINSFKKFQSSPYQITVSHPLQNYLQNLSSFEEGILHKYSIQCERASDI